MRVRADGLSVNCSVDGPEGAPWLVFSNSLMTTLAMWDEQIPLLTQSFRVLRYDQRGHGGTDVPEGAYTFDHLIGDLVALLDSFQIERAHVVGLSMGGTTALGLAQLHPARVDRLVVCDTSGISTPSSAEQWRSRVAIAEEQGMAPLVEPTIERWFPSDTIRTDPPYLDRVREMIRTTPVAGFRGGAAALSDVDFSSKIGDVTQPTLFVVGSRDGVLPGTMRQMHEALNGSEFVEIEGAGHLCNLDAPTELTAVLLKFLCQNEGRS